MDIVTRPLETARSAASKPAMVTIARYLKECCLTSVQVSASGFHVCALACSAVKEGSSFVLEMHRGFDLPNLHGVAVGAQPEPFCTICKRNVNPPG